jgi:uncharacterized repeat protein (TIGR03847 family)
MARQLFDYDPPERFVAGTVGEPGSRTFFLQARSGARLVSVALEKTQVSILAERVDELLDEVLRRSGGSAPVPAMAPADAEDNEPLETPIEEEFRVGAMSLAWEVEAQRVVIECYSEGLTPEDDTGDDDDDAVGEGDPTPGAATDPPSDPVAEPEAEEDGAVLRVSLTGAAARAFSKRALAVVAAGRPPCPFCTGPLDPDGHICPRANGYRR